MVLYPIDSGDRREIGRTREYVSAIGLGTWAIRDYARAKEVYVRAVTEYGIDNIDTAEMYDNGRAEEFVGEVVRAVGREHVFITTKMLPHRLRSRDEVVKAARASLKRLGVKYVDLFLIHWPNEYMSIEEQVRNFEAVYLEGYARYIGVSNFNVLELHKAIHATRSAEIVVDQVYYSVLHREIERDLLAYAIRNGITIQAYTPLERGAVKDHPVVKEVASRCNKTPIQVALNYLISRPRVVAIPKTENMDHLREIARAMGWRLDRELIEFLEKHL